MPKLQTVFACTTLLWGVCAASPLLVTLNTEDSPPFNMLVDGKIVGIAADKVRLMMEKTGIRYQIDLLPWRRAYEMALTQKLTCVFATTRTKEREPLFKWIGPLASTDWVLYGKAERKISLRSLEDARAYVIGTYNGDIRDNYFRSKGYRVDTAPDDNLNPGKLMAGRIDLWASGRYEGAQLLARRGLAGDIMPLLSFNHADLYLACNLEAPDSLIRQMENALNTLIQDGTSARIDRLYDHRSP
ncbi:substrate-binding periplasmic protein [Parachitinimonas caeni]|uniref:ABC transporter substrate-binding protein n=1 Tax=Parachitinimonas caeni TaxID=3031301 RepID=A0ABT7DXC4_9NEIS|nr:ABC transporter substrate-binding protein [Parachitinimonas caeni]MDK2124685.1 ABC transporter substrate-binding protein [Parachitinimonas caeni]